MSHKTDDHWEADRRYRRDHERERFSRRTSFTPRRLKALAEIHTNIAAGVIQPPVKTGA